MKKSILTSLIALLFADSAVSCSLAPVSLEERYQSADYVFTALVTGEFLREYEALNKAQIEKAGENFNETIMTPETRALRLLPIHSFKENDPPIEVTISDCGGGAAALREEVLVFAFKYETGQYGYFISSRSDASAFTAAVEAIREISH